MYINIKHTKEFIKLTDNQFRVLLLITSYKEGVDLKTISIQTNKSLYVSQKILSSLLKEDLITQSNNLYFRKDN